MCYIVSVDRSAMDSERSLVWASCEVRAAAEWKGKVGSLNTCSQRQKGGWVLLLDVSGCRLVPPLWGPPVGLHKPDIGTVAVMFQGIPRLQRVWLAWDVRIRGPVCYLNTTKVGRTHVLLAYNRGPFFVIHMSNYVCMNYNVSVGIV